MVFQPEDGERCLSISVPSLYLQDLVSFDLSTARDRRKVKVLRFTAAWISQRESSALMKLSMAQLRG